MRVIGQAKIIFTHEIQSLIASVMAKISCKVIENLLVFDFTHQKYGRQE